MCRVLQRPAEPARGDAEARRRRQANHFPGRYRGGEQRADAVEERVARCQHADRLAAPRQDLWEWRRAAATARPSCRRRAARRARGGACRRRRAWLARAAVRRQGRGPARPSSPMPRIASQGAVLALIACLRPTPRADSRRHQRGDGARASARRSRRCPSDDVARRAHRSALSAAAADEGRRLRGHRKGSRPISSNNASACWWMQRTRSRRRSRQNARAAASPRGMPARHRRPAIRGGRGRTTTGARWRTSPPPSAALGAAPRRVFLTIGRLQLAAFAGAPQHRYLVRTIDPADVILPRRAMDRGARPRSMPTRRRR